MLALAVSAYILVVVGTFVAAAATLWSANRRARRWGAGIWLAMIVECGYMLRAPACVYLPGVPGKATQRTLLGVDASHKVYWIEGTSPVAFLWGPRWRLVLGDALAAGIEFVPPIRYALTREGSWEVVSSDGGRRPYLRDLHFLCTAVRADGTVLGWGEELKELPPSTPEWRVVAPLPTLPPPLPGPPPRSLLVLEAVAVKQDGQTLEVYLDSQVLDASHGLERDLALIRRDKTGAEISRKLLSLPRAPSRRDMRHHLFATDLETRTLLFETWWEMGEGHGTTYALEPDGMPRQANSFDAVLEDGYPVEVSASSDGFYFTTGQTVFRMDGERVRDIEPMLSGCRWDGHTLYGVRRYPFFVSTSLSRASNLSLILAAAQHGIPHPDPGFRQRVRPVKEGWERGHWVLGGLDEAGREDEIVKVELP